MACPGIQTPAASRTPGLIAIDVTILVSVAAAKSTTPFHRSRLSTPLKPDGGEDGAGSASAKYIVFAHVPLTRTYAGPSAAASLRSLLFERSTGGRYS